MTQTEKKLSYQNKTKTFKYINVATFLLVVIIFMVLLGIFTPIIELGAEEGIIIIISSILLYLLYLNSLNSNLFKLKFQYLQSYMNELKTNTPDLVYMKNLKSEIVDCNKAFLNFFNLEQEKVNGNNFFYLFKDDEKKEILEFEKIVLTTQKSVQFNIHLTDQNGEEQTFQVLKSPMLDKSNIIIGTLNICRNITQQEENYNTKRNFVETLAHDIKNPIVAQSKILEFLLEEKIGTLNSDQKDLIKHIISSNQFALEMVTSMLASYRFSDENYRLKFITFDIKKMVQECINQLEITAYNKSLNINFEADNFNAPTVFYDQIVLQRLVTNLLFNAITYSHEKGEINIHLSQNKEFIIFEIENTATKSSLTKDNIKHIFDKYYIGTNKYKQVGSGIGLFLAKTIVKNLNGELIYDVIYKDEHTDIYKFGFKIKLDNKELDGKDFKF